MSKLDAGVFKRSIIQDAQQMHLDKVGDFFTDGLPKIHDEIEEKTGMTPADIYTMLAQMKLENKLEDIWEKKTEQLVAKQLGKRAGGLAGKAATKAVSGAFSVATDIMGLSDLYDIYGQSKIPNRKDTDAYTQAIFLAYENQGQTYRDEKFKQSGNLSGRDITPEVRLSDEYRKVTKPLEQVGRYFRIKHFTDSDLQASDCTYINTENLLKYINGEIPSSQLDPNQFKLNTSECPIPYQTAYKQYYIDNSPDAQIYDCYIPDKYLVIKDLYKGIITESNALSTTMTTGCAFEMKDKSGRIQLIGSYACISRPSSYIVNPNNRDTTSLSQAASLGVTKRYIIYSSTIDPVSGRVTSFLTNFSDPLVPCNGTNSQPFFTVTLKMVMDTDQYSILYKPSDKDTDPTYFVFQLGSSSIYALVLPSAYPRIILTTYNSTTFTFKGTGDILQYMPNVVSDPITKSLDLQGTWSIGGSTNVLEIGPKHANTNTAPSNMGLVTYMIPPYVNIGGKVGQVENWDIPTIRFGSLNSAGAFVPSSEPNSLCTMEGVGGYYKYRYKFVYPAQNGGQPCDPTLDIDDVILTERVPCARNDPSMPVSCDLAHYSDSRNGVTNGGWTDCFTDVNKTCQTFLTSPPVKAEDWGVYEQYGCLMRNADGTPMTTNLWYESRKATVNTKEKRYGMCDSYQIRSNVQQPASKCANPVPCQYTDWSDFGVCQRVTDSQAKVYGLDSSKWYAYRSRKVSAQPVADGAPCSKESKDFVQWRECPPVACEWNMDVSSWKTSSCFYGPDGSFIRTKSPTVISKQAQYGGTCTVPKVVEACPLSSCNYTPFNSASPSACFYDAASKTWKQTETRQLSTSTSTSTSTTSPICLQALTRDVPCTQSVNCVVSEPTVWSACKPYVGSDPMWVGKKVQTGLRTISQQSKYGGTACPNDLWVTRAC